MFYLSTNLQWCASYRRKIDISAFAVPKGVRLNRCSWRHLLFSAVYFNCYRNSELPVTRIARSLVQEIVIKFLAQGNVKIFVGKDQVQNKLLCVTPEQDFSVWPIRSDPFRSEPFRSGPLRSRDISVWPFRSWDISVTTFLYVSNLLHSFT